MSIEPEPDQNSADAEILSNLRASWKTTTSFTILHSPFLRRYFGKAAIRHLYTQVLLEPRTMAFVLLSRVGALSDPELAWHVYNLLLRVPDEVFQERWLSSIVATIDNVPGSTLRDRIALSQRVLENSFGLERGQFLITATIQ